jgi:hypothetical protein
MWESILRFSIQMKRQVRQYQSKSYNITSVKLTGVLNSVLHVLHKYASLLLNRMHEWLCCNKFYESDLSFIFKEFNLRELKEAA